MDRRKFSRSKVPQISEAIKGKIVQNVRGYDDGRDTFIAIDFEDGTSLDIRYDWIYDWVLLGEEKNEPA